MNNQYSRNDTEIARGRFRMKGDVLEIGPAYEDRLVRIELFGDEVEAIRYVDPTTGEILQSMDVVNIYPAKHFVTPKDRLDSDQCHPLGATGAAGCAQRRRQAAGGSAAGAAHQGLGDAGPGGLLQRGGELRPPPGRPRGGHPAGVPDRLPGRLAADR